MELAIASANQSNNVVDPLKTFFIVVAMAFGSAAVIVAILFIIQQVQQLRERRGD